MLYGPPGAGKGIQANLLADKLGLVHFDTGRFLESVVHDPKRKRERMIRRERRLFDTGKLLTPSFVLREVSREARRIAKCGLGLVFSGSPRTLYEAKGLIPLLEKLYGRKRVIPLVIQISPSVSIKRNSARLVCSFCGYPLLTEYYPVKRPTYCPLCGAKFYRRSLDRPEVIKVRLKEYENRTAPVLQFLKERGYVISKIDGRPAPHKVFQKISAAVARKAK